MISLKFIIWFLIVFIIVFRIFSAWLLINKELLLPSNYGSVRWGWHYLRVVQHEIPITYSFPKKFRSTSLIQVISTHLISFQTWIYSLNLLVFQILLKVPTIDKIVIIIWFDVKRSHLMLSKALFHGLYDIFKASQGFDDIHFYRLVLLDWSVILWIRWCRMLRLLFFRQLVDWYRLRL